MILEEGNVGISYGLPFFSLNSKFKYDGSLLDYYIVGTGDN
jgi:hypothetical protein